MKIQALIFDLDGTAIPSKVNGMPSEAVIKAVQQAKGQCHVAIASGRPYPYAQPILESLGIDDLCILSGGAVIYSIRDHKNVWQQQMDPEGIEEVLFPLKSFVGDHIMETDAETFKKYPVQAFSLKQPVNMACVYAVTAEEASQIVESTKRISGFAAHVMSSWTPGMLDVHITHELATKKHAMQALLAMLNVDHRYAMAVGDGGNDLPLFELAGIKVAMGNASETLKNAADWIAPSVYDDGLAHAIERYILFPTPHEQDCS